MKDRIKHWETSVIGVIALIGLGYKIYTSGGLSVEDFLLLGVSVGFFGYKKKEKKISDDNVSNVIDPDREYPDTRG